MRSTGHIHSATLAGSPRLRRVLDYLSDGLEHTTRDIVDGAQVMAVSACITELRRNGLGIGCRREDGLYHYRLLDTKAVAS